MSLLQDMVSADVETVNVMRASKALPVSAGGLQRAVRPQTTLCAMAEEPASVTNVYVMRDTSFHNARPALAVLIHVRLNCK